MGSSKNPTLPHQAGVYRDDPDRDDAASTSSAVLLDNIESYPDEELPAYSDLPDISSSAPKPPQAPRPNGTIIYYEPPTALPFSSTDLNKTEVRTHFPDYSTNTDTLLSMLHDQASFPPTYTVRLSGTHTETTRRGNKEEKSTITDFNIIINLTNLVQPTPDVTGKLELLPDNKRGYRGGIFKGLYPTAWERHGVVHGGDDVIGAGNIGGQRDIENFHPDELRAWCESYVLSTAHVKSFLLKREIRNHDTKKLTQLLRSAIAETNYRGHLQIDYPLQYKKVVVYSPGLINRWRTTTWIRWVFYLTFLWIFAWPILWLTTRKWEVVKVIYDYADRPNEGVGVGNRSGRTEDGVPQGERRCTVMSEVEWFQKWESSIRRAAVARMNCTDFVLDDEYRLATHRADERGRLGPQQRDIPRTGNSWADGAIGLLGDGLRVAEGWNAQRGWGGDD